MSKDKKVKERKLTAAEERRKAHFEEVKADLEEQGYRSRELIISIIAANVFGVALLAAAAAAVFGLMYAVHGSLGEWPVNYLWFAIAFIACIFIHEGIHGLTWAVFAKGHMKSIEFGFIVQMLTPYCTCSEPLKKHQYLLGTLMPLIILGILPSAAGIITGSSFAAALGVIMIMAAAGDIMIAWKVLRCRNTGDQLFVDHPYEGGSVVFER